MNKAMNMVIGMSIGLAVGAVATFVLVERAVLPERGAIKERVEAKMAEVETNVELLKKLNAEGYEANPLVLRDIGTGGQPLGRWKEGLTFEGVEPMPWLKSSANWFPKTEQVQPGEIRVTFMGSSPLPRPGQMGT